MHRMISHLKNTTKTSKICDIITVNKAFLFSIQGEKKSSAGMS